MDRSVRNKDLEVSGLSLETRYFKSNRGEGSKERLDCNGKNHR